MWVGESASGMGWLSGSEYVSAWRKVSAYLSM
jgi:hypothetical protein